MSSRNFSQKTNEIICFSILTTQKYVHTWNLKSKFKFQVFPSRQDRKTNLFICFLGEVMARQFCFEIFWPLGGCLHARGQNFYQSLQKKIPWGSGGITSFSWGPAAPFVAPLPPHPRVCPFVPTSVPGSPNFGGPWRGHTPDSRRWRWGTIISPEKQDKNIKNQCWTSWLASTWREYSNTNITLLF